MLREWRCVSAVCVLAVPARTRSAGVVTRVRHTSASKVLARLIRRIGIRKLMRYGLGRRTVQKIARRHLIRASALAEYESMIQRYVTKRKAV